MATFKTRARALDMLGRQQIAGVPTAISELFKNAHDAYADRVEVDYYRSDGLLVLRDDGIGMTEEEFTQRWLTLGTESKLGKVGVKPPAPPEGRDERQLLGEKGVGRLAIAILGPQVLVLTRARRDGVLGDTVAAFIHWGLFECPGVDLDQIDIPVRTFSGGRLPSRADLLEMVECFRTNVAMLNKILTPEDAARIDRELQMFDLDPSDVDSYQPHLSLKGGGGGTHFIIKPASEMLKADIDVVSDEGASNLVRMLGGFTNTMTPNHPDPVIKAAFRDHKTDDYNDNIIDAESFFTPQEFSNADHTFCGSFDRYGQFKGAVTVYGKEYPNHVISWKGAKGMPTKCGPFSIHVANVQGMARDTLLPLQDWNDLVAKMDRFGGLYIYRDGIRVLPYGNTDYDWLDIEKNRTKSASYYFFSFRRMFGVVDITHAKNSNLHEKAGREGFRENDAYREFRAILKSFFVQLAADFFRKDAEDPYFTETKERLLREDKLRKEREETILAKRNDLKQQLANFFASTTAGRPRVEVEQLLAGLKRALTEASAISDFRQAAESFLELESEFSARLARLEAGYRIARPKGMGLPKYLQKEWDDYVIAQEELQSVVFTPARRELESLVGGLAEQARIDLDRRIRIERSLESMSKEARKVANQERRATEERVAKVQQDVVEVARTSSARVRRVLEEVAADFARLNIVGMDDHVVVEARERLESTLVATRNAECERLQSIRTQLESIDLTGAGGLLDQMEAVEQRAIALEEQAGLDLQLTQLGMAIDVINHEFDSSIRSVRNNLRRLKGWADVNPNLEDLYQNIRNSFEHLDGYLTLFTPLHRRLYRKEIVMKGAEIFKFLTDLFGERLRRHVVSLDATGDFLNFEIVGYPSSFYPVFVNLVDNAIFWLGDQRQRVITLDVSGDALAIRDTGPGVPKRDREAIFEIGFSRKPGGRGMGLHISREVLQRVGYCLELSESGPGAEFLIKKYSDAVE